jgi:chemotaxis protein MotB
MTPSPPAPIVLIKKKPRHSAHHGGAWKVAYADFVTAMMALFIVLWLLNTSDQVKQAISAYFRDPKGAGKELGSGASGSGETLSVAQRDMANLQQKLQQAMKQSPELEALKDNVAFSVTGDGLRVEMIESEGGTFFDSGSPNPSRVGQEMIQMLAREMGHLPNDLMIEGHTDSRPFGKRQDYSNWELSADRANAARRLMEQSGLRTGQVAQVRGFADREPRDRQHPDSAANRRISVIVRYQAGRNGPGPEAKTAKAK